MKILITLLCASQLIILSGVSWRWGKEVSAQILIIGLICSLIWKRNKYVALFVLWCLFQFFLFKLFFVSEVEGRMSYNMHITAFLSMINIVLYGLFYYILHQIKLNKEVIYKTFCFIALVQSLYIFVQWLNLDQFFFHLSGAYGNQVKKSWCVGLWGNESLVSWCIALTSPFLLGFRDLRYKIGYGACFVAVCLTQCSTGILAFVLGFAFWAFFKNRKLGIILIVLLLTAGVLVYKSPKFTEYFNPTHRFGVWKKSIQIWNEGSGNPKVLDKKTITGYGTGTYKEIFWKQAPEFRDDGHWAQAHNEYVQILFEQGLIGFGIILCLMFTTFLKFWRKRTGLVPIMSLFILSILCINGFPMRTAMGVIPLVALVLFEKCTE